MEASHIINASAVLTPSGYQKDWGIRIQGGKIAEVGPNASLKAAAGDTVTDAKGQVILPGFVNGHTHMYGVLSHGITTDALVTEFGSFLEDFWWPYVEDRIDHRLAKLTAQWACVEMIESGVTTFFDILEGPNSIPGGLEAEAEAIHEAGLRGYLSFEACQRMSEENGQTGIAENADFFLAHQDDELVKGIMSIHTLFTCDKDFVLAARKRAREIGAKFHMHLSESVMEPAWCEEHYGMRTIEYYDSIGALDKDVVASQMVQLSDKEINMAAKSGMSAVSMPLSNCEVGGGVAPVPEMLAAGMQVGLGSDGYVNNFFEVMRGAFLIHKAYKQDTQAMPANVVYDMATAMGGRALGRPDLGVIAPGNPADVITMRVDDTPTPINDRNFYDQVVLFRNPADVINVYVAGKALKENGQLTTLNKEAIRAELREAAARFWAGE